MTAEFEKDALKQNGQIVDPSVLQIHAAATHAFNLYARGANQSLVAALPAVTKLERERCCDLARTMLVIHHHGGGENAASVGHLIR